MKPSAELYLRTIERMLLMIDDRIEEPEVRQRTNAPAPYEISVPELRDLLRLARQQPPRTQVGRAAWKLERTPWEAAGGQGRPFMNRQPDGLLASVLRLSRVLHTSDAGYENEAIRDALREVDRLLDDPDQGSLIAECERRAAVQLRAPTGHEPAVPRVQFGRCRATSPVAADTEATLREALEKVEIMKRMVFTPEAIEDGRADEIIRARLSHATAQRTESEDA